MCKDHFVEQYFIDTSKTRLKRNALPILYNNTDVTFIASFNNQQLNEQSCLINEQENQQLDCSNEHYFIDEQQHSYINYQEKQEASCSNEHNFNDE